jgi:chemotaxis protein CheX
MGIVFLKYLFSGVHSGYMKNTQKTNRDRQMKSDLLNPFVKNISYILDCMTGETPKYGCLSLKNQHPAGEVSVIFEVTGAVAGKVVIAGDRESMMRLAARMMMENRIEELEDVAISALGELGNMIGATAVSELSDNGYCCDITTSSVVTDTTVKFLCPAEIKTFVLPVELSICNMEISLSLAQTSTLNRGMTEMMAS